MARIRPRPEVNLTEGDGRDHQSGTTATTVAHLKQEYLAKHIPALRSSSAALA